MPAFSLSIAIIAGIAGCSSTHHTSDNSDSFVKNNVIAHRGAWKKNNFPQNSIASLREAVRIGCFGSEFDVHLTSDDSLVICHDDEYQGMTIEKTPYATLQTKKLSNGEKLPTLHEYLTEGMRQNKTHLILEIKKSVIDKAHTLQLTQKCVAKVHELNAQKWIVYISFDYDATKEVRKLDKNARIQYLNGDVAPAQLKADNINGLDYYITVFKEKPQWIAASKALHLDLNAWTVNKKEDLQYFIANGFDYITTNEPELLFELNKAK